MMKGLQGALREKREELIAKYIQEVQAGGMSSAFEEDEELNQLIQLCAKQRMNRERIVAAEAVVQ